MAPPLQRINPASDAQITFKVDRLGVLQNSALISANIYRPNGQLVSSDVAANFVASGIYTLFIDPLWSEDPGDAVVEGVYSAIVTCVSGGEQKTIRVRWIVDYSDDLEQ